MDDDAPPAISRRTLLATGAAAVGSALAQSTLGTTPSSAETGNQGTAALPVPDNPTTVPGVPPRTYGTRSSFERIARRVGETRSLTPLQDLQGMLTPSALHFERHHNGVPQIDPARHRLLVHGLVDRPMIFTVDEIRRFPAASRFAFLECSGNSGGEWLTPGERAQDTCGLLSTSEWTGVPLRTLLEEVGAKPEAVWMLAEGSDAAVMTRSIPLSEALDEALICYTQNGEALRPEQGYPLRLLLPGWEGNASIKWLRRLKLGTAPFMTREETAHYTDLMPDGTARQFTLIMDAKSLITSPSGGHRLQPGFVEIRGLAWSGRGRITGVEVSTDGGRSWHRANLQTPVLSKCTTVFRVGWHWTGQEAVLQSRCTDETGYVQPTRAALMAVRGLHSYYHYNAIQSWRVARDGTVHNVHL